MNNDGIIIDQLKYKCYKGNILLPENNLVILTWGNLSIIDRESNMVAIKPSGVNYDDMNVDDIPIVNLDGNVIEGTKNSSCDTLSHLELYKAFKDIGCVIHTHSKYATIFAQAKQSIKCLGTTHADYFLGDIPVTDDLLLEQLDEYEKNIGTEIVHIFNLNRINYKDVPACLVASHGVFVWGQTVEKAIENAIVLENIAEMAYKTKLLDKYSKMDKNLINKHYNRKHGEGAYYGQ